MKRFRTTYIIALILISIFVVVGELAVQLGLSTLSDDSRIINLSGRQRMLSQRITKNALILNQTSDYNEFQERKKELTEALANWRKAHEALQKGDITLGITKTANTKEITAKFNELQPIFDEMREAASKITTYDFNSLDSAARVELNANTQILVNNEVKFLPIMEEITFMYEKETKSKTNTVGIITWAVGVSIIGLVILLAIFFFEPVVKKMNTYLEEIEKQNKKIQASEAEIRQIAEKQLEANEQLFLAQKQMQEKNAELEKAKQATEKLLKEQEEANKKLALAQRELQKTLVEQNRVNQKLIEAQRELARKAENLEKSEQRIRLIAEEQRVANEKLQLAQQELTQKAQELERSEKEMRALAEAQLEANEKLLMAQKQIQESTALQKSILESAGLSIISTDTEGTITSINPTGLIWLQYTEEELVNKQTPALFHEISEIVERSQWLSSKYQENIVPGFEVFVYEAKKGIIQSVEYTYVRKDGTKFPISLTVSAIRDAQGKIVGYLGIAEDITKRKRAEEELKKAAEQFQDLFNTSRDALLLLDEKGFFECNEAAVLLYGCQSKEDLIGKTPIDYSPATQNDGRPSAEAAMDKIKKAMQEGSAFFEWTHTKKDGSVFPAEVLLSRVNFEGRIVLQATVRDITLRKQVEKELEQSLENQKIINESLVLAQQEAAQKAQELERSEKEMRALAEAQLEANEKLMLAEKQLKESLELEQKQRAELDRLVAQLKETQGQLVHNEKMASLGQLTAGIAHEINNPINFVYNGIDTLKVSLDDLMEIVNKYNELDNANGNKDAVIEEAKRLKQQLDFEELTQDIEHLVADIKRGAVRTMEIVKGLRVFSRLDEEERKMASIKDCLDSTLILLNSKMKGRVELKKYYDESMPDIMCYPGQLNQVFMNIINNAIQAIPEDRKDGEISIYTENQQENIIIRIKDNGIGMSEQVKRRIFEPFFTTKAVGVGTGLGLSITFGIIEKHGGNIFVNSEEGKGTEFVIQLPKEKI